MAQVKAIFYLPIQDNDGRDLSAEIAETELNCYLAFDGWTEQGEVRGMYRPMDHVQTTSAILTRLFWMSRTLTN